MKYYCILCLFFLLKNCSSNEWSNKIHFDLRQLDEQGLSGTVGGKVAIDYEFCIPADETVAQKVQSIDPSLQILKSSRGRIQCSKTQWLCIGNTHQKNWQQILEKLAALDYIERIERTYWE